MNTAHRIFQNFRKAFFQFRVLLRKVRKTIFRCLNFFGRVRITIYKMSLIIWPVASVSNFELLYRLTSVISKPLTGVQQEQCRITSLSFGSVNLRGLNISEGFGIPEDFGNSKGNDTFESFVITKDEKTELTCALSPKTSSI